MGEEKRSVGFARKFKDKFLKEKVDYFEIFIEGVRFPLEAAKKLQDSISHEDIYEKDLLVIREIKKEGSKHVDTSLRIVEDAFITPIDQRDIIEILNGIDDILHSIESVAKHLYIMKVPKSDAFMVSFVDNIISISERLYDLMVIFREFKKHPKAEIFKLISEIGDLEEEGDRIYAEGMIHIFDVEKDPIELMKKKEIYKRLEYSLDCFNRVADMVGNLIVATL
ncbi:DUF47 domain-containing protein [Parasporobacterium paucivorans]|uniref:TIGR00153 family protein n=1 Tax=Parasporobacterium paucivorans DSM 15970 TaxID=1122934 RepID=A0A1M6L9F8_9FIRM|nr:DUF47 family protein [Parasporobacterium paucivorans]SHJ67840.1 hypothetical protein SAMN02745691_02358 [Parasporobacterium paucivorans DSM 15970]